MDFLLSNLLEVDDIMLFFIRDIVFNFKVFKIEVIYCKFLGLLL